MTRAATCRTLRSALRGGSLRYTRHRVERSTSPNVPARRPVPATGLPVSVDTLALVLAALIAIAVVAGVLPAVPW